MRKFLALILTLSMICSMSTTAFATSNSAGTTRAGIIGTIAHEETVQLTQEFQTLSENTGTAVGLSTMSYVENPDGSYTTYQYLDGVLFNKFSSVPFNKRGGYYET